MKIFGASAMKNNRPSKLIVLTTAVALLFGIAVHARATAADTIYVFNVESTRTRDSATGNVVHMSGAGKFNVTAGDVRATGYFTLFSSTGEVLARGTWRATDFVDFVSTGFLNRGIQNGVLHINVTLFPIGSTPMAGVLMGVICPPNEGPGEGVTLIIPGGASFNVPISGFTNFSLISE